jgi:hypothetical protein
VLLIFVLALAALLAVMLLWLGQDEPPTLVGPTPGPRTSTAAEEGDAVQTPMESAGQDTPAAETGRSEIPAEFSTAEQIPARDSAGDLSLTLRVRDDRGLAVELILLHAYHTPAPLEDGTQPGTLHLARSVGEASGMFKVTGFCAGEWTLILSAPAHGWSAGRGRELVRVQLPHGAPLLDVVLPRPARVEGVVLDAVGRPLEDVEIETNWNERDQSDENGLFQFSALPAGPLTLHATWGPAEAQTQVLLLPGSEVRDVVIRFPATGRIEGWVFNTQGQAATGIDVVLLAEKDKLGSTRSDEFGGFRFNPVLPGEYMLVAAYMDLAEDSDPSFFEKLLTQQVVVEAGQTTEVTMQRVEPSSAVRVYGMVLLAGEPVDGGTLFAVSEGGVALETARAAVIGSDGFYSMQLESHGPVMFFEGNHIKHPVSVADIPPVAEFRHDLDLPAGAIVAKVQGGRGVVVVQLHALDGFYLQADKGSETGHAGDSGIRRFTRLLPGQYVVGARDESGQVARSSVLELHAGEERTVHLSLTGASRVTGTVVDSQGRPVPGVLIAVSGARNAILHGNALSNALGEFALGGLPEIEVMVQAGKDQQCCRDSCVLEAGKVSRLKLVLAAAGSLLVEVRDRAGNPRSAHLRLLDDGGREVASRMRLDSELSPWTILSNEVRLSGCDYGHLLPGRYTIRVRTLEGIRMERTVRIEAGQRNEQTLTLD